MPVMRTKVSTRRLNKRFVRFILSVRICLAKLLSAFERWVCSFIPLFVKHFIMVTHRLRVCCAWYVTYVSFVLEDFFWERLAHILIVLFREPSFLLGRLDLRFVYDGP